MPFFHMHMHSSPCVCVCVCVYVCSACVCGTKACFHVGEAAIFPIQFQFNPFTDVTGTSDRSCYSIHGISCT